jgi:S-adenosylmethionine:tRNA ribosyltransferase-isomerase
MIAAASRPPEQRGLSRDGVRLLAATPDGVVHARFSDLPRFLSAGDLLVVNTSATIAAAVSGRRGDGRAVAVHLSAVLEDATWVVELRADAADRGQVTDALSGETVWLPAGESITLLDRYPDPAATRLWRAAATVSGEAGDYLAQHGRPIRYSYVPEQWPLAAYQTVFARDAGSAEMPSAGRPFTAELVTRLISAGVFFAPVTLHAGVASLEAGEPPLPERFTVPEPTAQLVNLTRAAGRRVIAVGTTVTRALETAAGPDGTTRASRGWTRLVLGAGRPARVVTGLITGWHEPRSSHLALLQAVAGPTLVHTAYAAAEESGYLWHEFGDSCLLLPPAGPAGHSGRARERSARTTTSRPSVTARTRSRSWSAEPRKASIRASSSGEASG